MNELVIWAERLIGNDAVVSKEKYGDQSSVYGLRVPTGDFFLKIGKDLSKEHERLEWLDEKLPVPKVIGFTRIRDDDALLLSAMPGKNLGELKKEWPAEKVVDALVVALRRFHAVDVSDWPFGPTDDGVLVHGDACLPNFIFNDGGLSGYIDLGEMMVGDPEADLAAAVWSLHYNLGPGYGSMFLERYGAKNVTDEYVEALRRRYEGMQQSWGL